MCLGCRRLGFVESSPAPEPEDDREDEERPQSQPQQFDRPARRKKLVPKPKTIVHSAPSHNGIPAFVAYSVPADTPDNAELTLLRPAYAYVFCDTSPGALNLGRAKYLARSIFDGIKNNRNGLPERIEVFAMPLPPPPEARSLYSAEELGLDLVLSQESLWYARRTKRVSQDPQDAHCLQHATACINHYEREVQSRLANPDRAEALSWYLPEGFGDSYYPRHIIIVDRLEDEPKNPPGTTRGDSSSYGRGLMVSWRRLRDLNKDEDKDEDDEAPPLVWGKVAFDLRNDGDDITIWVDNGFREVEGPQERPLSKRQRGRLWLSHHYSASGGGISDVCRQHDRKDWTSGNPPYTGGVRAIAEWARDNKGYFIWGDFGGGCVWRTALIGGSNSGRNARSRGRVTDPGIATRAFVGTDDVRDDANWTHDRGRDFSSSTGGWRVASYGWETCGLPGPYNVPRPKSTFPTSTRG
ncbi:hypothetical protein CSHISOI_09739 [Colletotrichum shisoi]|uniref:Uncharacterized protein n=1 Tax=Colletotrichum shisoi TaxID=2078593 RepID=A0A5Q4BFY1_9PEZI|nr:hypothetical protein CSHISOI_09739 [Colletotrichum shisoi]